MAKTLKEILNCNDGEIREWLSTAPLEDVEGFIAGSSPHGGIHRHAINERDRRYALMARKPHWTITPAFIVGLLAMIFAAIAAWPVIRDWFPKPPVVPAASVVQSPSVPAAPLQRPAASPSAAAISLPQPAPVVSAATPTPQATPPPQKQP